MVGLLGLFGSDDPSDIPILGMQLKVDIFRRAASMLTPLSVCAGQLTVTRLSIFSLLPLENKKANHINIPILPEAFLTFALTGGA